MVAHLRTYAGVIAWVFIVLLMLYVTEIGAIHPLPKSQLVNQVDSCVQPDCTEARRIDLPFFSPVRYTPGIERHAFRFTFQMTSIPDEPQAIFVPKFSRDLQISLNGNRIYTPPDKRHLWNDPLLVDVPPSLLALGENRVDLVLSGPIPGLLDLRPLYFGDLQVLTQAYGWRYMLGQGLTRLALELMVFFAIVYVVIWIGRRQDRTFLWLGLSCLCAGIFLAMLGVSFPVGDYRNWRLLQAVAMSGYVYFMLKFIRAILGIAPLRIERVLPPLIGLGALATALVPIEIVYTMSMVVSLLAAVAGIEIVAMMWRHRDRVPRIDFLVFFPALSLALALAFDSVFLSLTNTQARSLNLMHLMPLITSLVCLWLILSRLIRSLNGQEQLTAALQGAIAQKTAELEASYDKLAAAERAQAIGAERSRIMLELHDGVGGQLVNTLAYMESHAIADPTLRGALEDALSDLALMLDSIENQDSLATLLGMMRTRLEGLLAKHGVEFDWQIQQGPLWPAQDLSDNLQIARIVQEAITNVVKHAEARTVTVYADRDRVTVSDDGKGFDPADLATHDRLGLGLSGMRRRAAKLGATLTIDSDKAGTKIRLDLPSTPTH